MRSPTRNTRNPLRLFFAGQHLNAVQKCPTFPTPIPLTARSTLQIRLEFQSSSTRLPPRKAIQRFRDWFFNRPSVYDDPGQIAVVGQNRWLRRFFGIAPASHDQGSIDLRGLTHGEKSAQLDVLPV